MACSLRGIAALLLVLLLLPATPVIAFNAPVLASLVNPAVDTCAADPEGWVKGPVTSAAQEAAVRKVRSLLFLLQNGAALTLAPRRLPLQSGA